MRSTGAVLAGGLVLILVALAFGTTPLFVPGLALVLIGVLVPAWIALAARGAGLRRTLAVERVLEGQPIEAMIELRHGRLGLPGCEVLDPLAGAPLGLWIPLAHVRGAVTELRVVARFERRGRRTLRAPMLRVSDPLGLITLERAGEGAGQELLVLPRLERPRPLRGDPSGLPRLGGGAPSPETLAAVEIDGLRAYQVGTPASRIHWPALARGAGLLERRLRADAGLGPLVVLDTRCAQADEHLDEAVRAAASLSHSLARRGGCELLLPGQRRTTKIEPDLGAWPGAHARLAVVEGGPAAPAPGLPPRSGTVFYVAADPSFAPLRHPAAQLRNAVLIVPGTRASEMRGPAVLEVAGCLGFLLGGSRRAEPRGRRKAA